MKIVSFLVMAILAGLLCVACSTTNASNSDSSPKIASSTPTRPAPGSLEAMEQEAEVRNSIISAALVVAKNASIPEANAVADWLLWNATPASVSSDSGNGKISLAGPQALKGRKLPIILTYEKGNARNTPSIAKWLTESKAQGELFVEGGPYVLIRGGLRNGFELGLTILHEGLHAMEHFEKEPITSQGKAYRSEVRARELENKVRSAIGGKDYVAIVAAEQKRLLDDPGFKLKINPDGESLKFYALTPKDWGKELDRFFGQYGIESDRHKRNQAVWNQAIYNIVEDTFPKECHEDVKATIYLLMEVNRGKAPN